MDCGPQSWALLYMLPSPPLNEGWGTVGSQTPSLSPYSHMGSDQGLSLKDKAGLGSTVDNPETWFPLPQSDVPRDFPCASRVEMILEIKT